MPAVPRQDTDLANFQVIACYARTQETARLSCLNSQQDNDTG